LAESQICFLPINVLRKMEPVLVYLNVVSLIRVS
jgi:hypothetical protein